MRFSSCSPSAPGHAAAQAGSALVVRVGDEWEEWWDGDAPPERWAGALDRVADAAGWTAASAGVDRGELTIRRVGEPWRIRVVLVRIDPALVDLRLMVPPPGMTASRAGGASTRPRRGPSSR